MSSVTVLPDTVGIANLINDIQSSTSGLASSGTIGFVVSGNQSIVGQLLTSLSQQFNKMNNQSLDKAISSKIIYYHK